MLEAYLRPTYQRVFLQPIASCLNTYMPSPNYVTLLAGITGIFCSLALALSLSWTALFFLVFSGFFDTLDGTLARLRDEQSSWGCIVDITCDRFVEFCVLFGLYLQAPSRAIWLIFMLGSILLCVTVFLLTAAFTEKTGEKSLNYSLSFFDRPEAFVIFAAMIIWPQAFVVLAVIFLCCILFTTVVRLKQLQAQIGFCGIL